MGQNSGIEWTDDTFNPWIGCSKVSPGCTHCYAETLMDHRHGKAKWGDNGTRVRTSEAYWKKPLTWDRQAKAAGVRRRVFCASLADVFEDRPELVPWRADLFDLISRTPNLDWLLLTKRPDHIFSLSPIDFPSNVWLGTSVETQEQDWRASELRRLSRRIRFLSLEPLLGPIDLYRGGFNLLEDMTSPTGIKYGKINWVIIGCESNGKKVGRLSVKPSDEPRFIQEGQWHIHAARIVHECKTWGVPVFVKQIPIKGLVEKDINKFPEPLRVREWPERTK